MKATGTCPPRKALSKIFWSWVGAFLGIYLIALLEKFTASIGIIHILLIGSFGASAVLVYGTPMADFSQPRNLVGGHTVSAMIGIAVFTLVKEPALASATAVSLAVIAMHFTRTLHPPGGATALIAVIGGDQVHSLGYIYVFCPVLTGALMMLLVALLVNNLSANPKRQYPVYWL
jgi:CBS domain-containing membrane protein